MNVVPIRRARSLTPAEVRRVAVEGGVDPRTVKKYLVGARVVSTCEDRVRRALEYLGYPDPQRGTSP